MSRIDSVNVGRAVPTTSRGQTATGIDKHPTDDAVELRDPGPKHGGLGSGLVGDFIGSGKHHGGDDQAVYAVAREELDGWERRLGRRLRNGFFGENLTTVGVDVDDARLGERWQIGDTVVLQVTCPRIPCATFRAQMGEKGWVKTFTQHGRSGAYLRIVTPGAVRSGDPVTVIHRPSHDVTVSMAFRALTTERELLPGLLAAGDGLVGELRERATAQSSFATSSAARSPERTAPSM